MLKQPLYGRSLGNPDIKHGKIIDRFELDVVRGSTESAVEWNSTFETKGIKLTAFVNSRDPTLNLDTTGSFQIFSSSLFFNHCVIRHHILSACESVDK